MNLKNQFLERVKSAFPAFNHETDKVIIAYSGNDNSFESFKNAIVRDKSGKRLSGEWICDNDSDMLFQILDSSGVYFSYVDASVNGTIRYANKRLWVENTQCEKTNSFNNYVDDDLYWYDGDITHKSNETEWNCTDEKGAVLDEDEDLYDVYDLNEDGQDSFDRLETTRNLSPRPSLIPSPIPQPKQAEKPQVKKIKPTQKRNKKTISKAKKKVTKLKAKKTVKKKAVKKKK